MSDRTSNQSVADSDTELAKQLAAYRSSREALERHILPLATSIDGSSKSRPVQCRSVVGRRGSVGRVLSVGAVGPRPRGGPRAGLSTRTPGG